MNEMAIFGSIGRPLRGNPITAPAAWWLVKAYWQKAET